MRLAQQLYEDGIITYLRTDSTRVSDEAVASSKAYISENFGEEYCANIVTEKKSEQKIQDAHEAIRPTDIASTPTDLKETLSRDLFRLYQLIWKRFTASRMSEARYNTVSVKIDAKGHRFTVSASKLAFEGFMSVYKDEDEDKAEPNTLVKDITKDTKLTLGELESKQHFTQPPAHYTEASLVRALEELGIGRPSTYAPTITTILGRRYIIKEDKNLYVSELGEVVNNMMVDAFPSIVDVNFTANLEALLDKVEAGTVDWKTVVSNFYPDLEEAVKKAENELEQVEIKDEVSDEVCDVCGRNMVIKYGPHGKFLACPGFPECRNTKPYFEKIGVTCPKCGKEIVVKKTKKGRKYYGCEANPECDFMVWQRPAQKKCEKCGNVMFKKGNRLVCANEQCGFNEKLENDQQN
jgi:DNA topoisomerase-1